MNGQENINSITFLQLVQVVMKDAKWHNSLFNLLNLLIG